MAGVILFSYLFLPYKQTLQNFELPSASVWLVCSFYETVSRFSALQGSYSSLETA